MIQEILISNIKIWIKKNNKHSKRLIVFIPGVFSDVQKDYFLSLLEIKTGFDVLIYNLYSQVNIGNINKSVNDFVLDLENILNNFKKEYKEIFIIAYSFGSEVVLRANTLSIVKAVALWSPSFAYPQNITETLQSHQNNKKVLVYNKTLIGKKLTKDLDKMDTIKLIPHICFPVHVYLSCDDYGEKSWANQEIFKLIPSAKKNIARLSYKHTYTKKQAGHLYRKTCDWFDKNF